VDGLQAARVVVALERAGEGGARVGGAAGLLVGGAEVARRHARHLALRLGVLPERDVVVPDPAAQRRPGACQQQHDDARRGHDAARGDRRQASPAPRGEVAGEQAEPRRRQVQVALGERRVGNLPQDGQRRHQGEADPQQREQR
jgi:hypothetical protein